MNIKIRNNLNWVSIAVTLLILSTQTYCENVNNNGTIDTNNSKQTEINSNTLSINDVIPKKPIGTMITGISLLTMSLAWLGFGIFFQNEANKDAINTPNTLVIYDAKGADEKFAVIGYVNAGLCAIPTGLLGLFAIREWEKYNKYKIRMNMSYDPQSERYYLSARFNF
jgi:hypothetical protein